VMATPMHDKVVLMYDRCVIMISSQA